MKFDMIRKIYEIKTEHDASIHKFMFRQVFESLNYIHKHDSVYSNIKMSCGSNVRSPSTECSSFNNQQTSP